jgi:hypothetical protein
MIQSADCFDKILYKTLIHIFCPLLQKANITNENLKQFSRKILLIGHTRFLKKADDTLLKKFTPSSKR